MKVGSAISEIITVPNKLSLKMEQFIFEKKSLVISGQSQKQGWGRSLRSKGGCRKEKVLLRSLLLKG